MIPDSILKRVKPWLSQSYDEQTRAAVRKMLVEDEAAVIDSFYKDLSFGTGGMRGLMGVGTNRMNRYTIAIATQGLAQYLKKCFSQTAIVVVIAHDSRNYSAYFAAVAADVLLANGIDVRKFEGLRPTPLLSYAIGDLKAQSGIVITASHNPKEYNGYKVYWQHQGQITPPHDANIIREVQSITDFSQVQTTPTAATLEVIKPDLESRYLQKVKALSLNPDLIAANSDFKIVYTPIHGSGITLVPAALALLGFKNVHIVASQAEPNGDFPTVIYPNPEEEEAMKLGVEEARRLKADILLGTDPDADRVGIAVKDHKGNFRLLNGNQTALLVFYYLLAQRQARELASKQDFIAKTIVTTDLIHKVARAFEVQCFDTLTGFKYIADLIRQHEGRLNFIAGAEESYGLMIGTFGRDKDAVSAVAMICELACFAKVHHKSLFHLLVEIYRRYGFYKEHLVSVTKTGKAGEAAIKAMMADWRKNSPKSLDGEEVIEVRDYLSQELHDLKTGTKTRLDLPVSNVLQFSTATGTKVSARPSGTEPKIKFYISVNTALKSSDDFDETEAGLDAKIKRILLDLKID